VENPSVARVLNEIADLLELKGENIFRVRAYRTGAQVVADSPVRVADLDVPALLAIDGIGKDLAARIRDIAGTGTTGLRDELLQLFPASILEVMRLQGIGPKTVALLYHTLKIASLDDLEAAAKAGAIRGLKGMGAKKEALIAGDWNRLQVLAKRPSARDADNTQHPHAEVLAAGEPRSTHQHRASFEAPLCGAPQDEERGGF
jgi:DNA polymerase (family 10)